MKLSVMSDLHLEFHKDGGLSFIESLDPKGIDVLVLAGDICVGYGIPFALADLCAKYPEVVFVLGNHEYYGHNRKETRRFIEQACRKHSNLHWLDNSDCEVAGAHFVGGTLWFKKPPPRAPKEGMNDFFRISGLERWVYKENADCQEKLGQLIRPGSIVVTHHLPSYRSVHEKFVGNDLNPFFVCDVEASLIAKGPALWLHGHTHESADYRVGSTRVVCNPFGYVRIEENPLFDEHLILEIP